MAEVYGPPRRKPGSPRYSSANDGDRERPETSDGDRGCRVPALFDLDGASVRGGWSSTRGPRHAERASAVSPRRCSQPDGRPRGGRMTTTSEFAKALMQRDEHGMP